jgi:hypothetical protein
VAESGHLEKPRQLIGFARACLAGSHKIEIFISERRAAERARILRWWICTRALTGLDFRAPTHADLAADEAHFLDINPKTEEVELAKIEKLTRPDAFGASMVSTSDKTEQRCCRLHRDPDGTAST